MVNTGVSALQALLAILPTWLLSNAAAINTGSLLLWLYKHNNTLNGVPVEADSSGLAFKNLALLMLAMLIVLLIQVWSGYLSPLHKLDLQAYQSIRNKANTGLVYITSLDKQYDAQARAFICLLVYGQRRAVLKLRFNYYRLDE